MVHVEGNQSLPDGEETVLRHLSSLRAAVTEGIGQAPDINALRTILRDMFQHIELIASPGYGT